MELRARTRHLARPAAFTAALAALLALVAGPATADAAKAKKRYPVVTLGHPDERQGRRHDLDPRAATSSAARTRTPSSSSATAQRAVFAKETLGTAKLIRVVVPEALRWSLVESKPTRVRVRVLAERFGKTFTAGLEVAVITRRAAARSAARAPARARHRLRHGRRPRGSGDPRAAGQGLHRATRTATCSAPAENELGLDSCKADTDGDGVPDGYEYQSARDLNDDEYQEPERLPARTRASGPTRTRSTRTPTSTTTATASRCSRSTGSGTATAPSPPAACCRRLPPLLLRRRAVLAVHRDGGTGRRRPTRARRDGYAKADDFLDWADVGRLPNAGLRCGATTGAAGTSRRPPPAASTSAT